MQAPGGGLAQRLLRTAVRKAVDDAIIGVQAGSPLLEVTLQLGECHNQPRQRPAQCVRELVAGDGAGPVGHGPWTTATSVGTSVGT